MNSELLIDSEAIERLKEVAVHKDKTIFVCEIIDLFIQTFPASIEHLQQSIEHQDQSKIFRSSHQLRGLCLSVGAVQMLAICLDLEARLPLGDFASMKETLEKLKASARATVMRLQEVAAKLHVEIGAA